MIKNNLNLRVYSISFFEILLHTSKIYFLRCFRTKKDTENGIPITGQKVQILINMPTHKCMRSSPSVGGVCIHNNMFYWMLGQRQNTAVGG